MNAVLPFWKNLSLHLFLMYEGLFISTITWDFFLTVVTKELNRTFIFSSIIPWVANFVVVYWIIIIVFLLILLFINLIRWEKGLTRLVGGYEYSTVAFLYGFMIFFLLIGPSAPWPLLLNYLVNVIWALSIIYFCSEIQDGILLNINGMDYRSTRRKSTVNSDTT